MDCNTLKEIRQQMYDCFERGADALFNMCDALLCENQARSLPELSQSPFFERGWSSLYQALEQGKIDEARLQQVLVKALLANCSAEHPLWISVDASSIARPVAETSEDRGIIHVSNVPHASKPISVGWQFSTVMLLPQDACSSWVGILDQRRIATKQTAIEVAIAQLRALAPLLGCPVLLLADRWYATSDFLQGCKELGFAVLIRLKSNRKLYRRAPVPTGKKGRPALDGAVLQPKRAETLHEADESWHGSLPNGKPAHVQRWKHLHVRQARTLEMRVLRVQRPSVSDSKRDPRVSWFVVLDETLPLSQVASVYAHRFSQEHGYRFLKQDLFWSQVHVRTPAQFERWSVVVSIVMNQLCLARTLGQACYRPWERRRNLVTPRQIRRVLPAILLQVGTPAGRCQPRGKSPGRTLGFHPNHAPRHPVVLKRPNNATEAGG